MLIDYECHTPEQEDSIRQYFTARVFGNPPPEGVEKICKNCVFYNMSNGRGFCGNEIIESYLEFPEHYSFWTDFDFSCKFWQSK